MNELDLIISYESGELDEQQTIDLFQRLVDSGIVWNLQGSYGRTAEALIDAGLVKAKEVKDMIVDGFCHSCGKQFDAHWLNYPNPKEAILKPYCTYCKSYDVHTLTDESNDYHGSDEYEEDESEYGEEGYNED